MFKNYQPDPERVGIVGLDANGKAVPSEEKLQNRKSNYQRGSVNQTDKAVGERSTEDHRFESPVSCRRYAHV
jgi:dTDP-glucose pyrophosphorylase